jgi:hypothetical protein
VKEQCESRRRAGPGPDLDVRRRETLHLRQHGVDGVHRPPAGGCARGRMARDDSCRRPSAVPGGSRRRVRTASAVHTRVPAQAARRPISMGPRQRHPFTGRGRLVHRLRRIERRHHRAQAGRRIVAPEAIGADGSAAARGHWQLAMGFEHGRSCLVGRAVPDRGIGASLVRGRRQQSSAHVLAGTLGTDYMLRRGGDAIRHAVRARR